MRQAHRDFIVSHSKKISLFVLFVGVVFSLFVVSRNITGLTTGVEKIQENLVHAQDSVNFVMQERESCYGDLDYARGIFNSCQSNLVSANTNLNLCKSEKTELQQSYNTCAADKKNAQEQLSSKTADYDGLARNSAIDICCSISDVKSGIVRSWSITAKNGIECSGNFTINCTSGNVTK